MKTNISTDPVINEVDWVLFKESVEYNLATLLPKLDLKPVKGSAFSIARYKLKIDFFLELNKMVFNHIEALKPKLWKNYRLIAGDGSTISVPASPVAVVFT
ncbi:MAG: hypothetical protein EAZ53_08035 [Bacteroidetes bacterium]|nr:MAG: hypothetical protein EAZ53_08035 [Bacteroidota bacterium]